MTPPKPIINEPHDYYDLQNYAKIASPDSYRQEELIKDLQRDWEQIKQASQKIEKEKPSEVKVEFTLFGEDNKPSGDFGSPKRCKFKTQQKLPEGENEVLVSFGSASHQIENPM